jgi:hypothetical protein
MAIATLDAIRTKFRRLTVSGSDFQITDSEIDDYINSFYLYDFPAQFRSLKLKDVLTFVTTQNQDVYPFDSENYTTVQNPCYVAKREVALFRDPWSFYANWFNWQQFVNFAYGDGTVGPYTTSTLQSVPMLMSANNDVAINPNHISRVQNVLITANTASGTLNVTDDGTGLLYDCATGTAAGTINYQTGAISVTFTAAVPSGNNIQIQYNPTTPSIPLAIMFYQNQFTLRPVPNAGYTVEVTAYRLPSAAIANPNNYYPELNEWWETIAFGAAKKFYEDRIDMDGVAMMDKGLAERYALNDTRTYAQLGSQRINTLFAPQLSNNYANNSGWFGPGG